MTVSRPRPNDDPPSQSPRLKPILALAVIIPAYLLLAILSPRDYPGAYIAPACPSPHVSTFKKRGFVSLTVTNCLLSEAPHRQVSDWYFKSSHFLPTELPGYPSWAFGPMTFMVYAGAELPPAELLGSNRSLGQTAIISTFQYGIGWHP